MLQVRDGDLGQLGLLFERHHRSLYNYFLRLTGGAREISEDLVQDVFFRMLKYRHTYKGTSKFTMWMFQIARNARFDHLKKRKREMLRDDEKDEVASEDPIPVDNIESYQEIALLHKALGRLDADDRDVLLLSRFRNLKYKEIAAIYNCAEGTIKARVHRAMRNLRDAFYQLSGEPVK